MISTQGLTKRYGEVHAVDGIDLEVREGDVYGFLGANGSGKTTTVRMLLGLVLATSGEAELFGEPMPRSAKTVLPRVGALVEGPGAYPHLSAHTNLALLDAAGTGSLGRKARRARIHEVLEQVSLDPADSRPVKTYSLGMRQRLGLAAALMRRPPLLVLDEPTNGLDPQGIRDIRRLLLELNREGTTIFLSSHLLAEIEQMSTRIGVLDRGTAGAAGRAVGPGHRDRSGAGGHPRRCRRGGVARRARGAPRGRPDRRTRGRPGRAQRPAGRCPGADPRAHAGASDAGGDRAGCE